MATDRTELDIGLVGERPESADEASSLVTPEQDSSGAVDIDHLDLFLEQGDIAGAHTRESEEDETGSVLCNLIPLANLNNNAVVAEEKLSCDVPVRSIDTGQSGENRSLENSTDVTKIPDGENLFDSPDPENQSHGDTHVCEVLNTVEKEVSLEDSVRSLKDVLLVSDPVQDNSQSLDLSGGPEMKELEDSQSEFEDECVEQESDHRQNSESDSEFEVPDRPIDVSKFKADSSSNSVQNDKVSSNLQPGAGVTMLNDEMISSPYPNPSGVMNTQVQDETLLASQKVEVDLPVPEISFELPTFSSRTQGDEKEMLPASSEDVSKTAPEVQNSDDWENITTIQAEFAENKNGLKSQCQKENTTPLLSINEATDHFRETVYGAKANIRTSVERHGFAAITHFLFGPPSLGKHLHTTRELVFCIAATPLDNDDNVHTRILQSIYRCLTGSRFDCQRFGSHWEEIGFQGRDPATDVRGVGMLGLFHLLFFLRNPKTAQLARDVYKLSLHPTQNFPFCVMGINMSRICIQTLREGHLNRECNKRGQVLTVVNEFYVGCFLQMFQLWKHGKTIENSGYVIKEIENVAKKNTKSVFRNVENYLKQKPTGSGDMKVEEDLDNYFSVCKVEEGDAVKG